MTNKEKKICEKYSSHDKDGYVHCFECPLRITKETWDFRCKANSIYNRHTKEWELIHDT